MLYTGSGCVEQVHLTDECQRNKTREFHWLLKIVARLRRELGSLNENFTALFLLFCFSPGTYPQSKIKIAKILLRH